VAATAAGYAELVEFANRYPRMQGRWDHLAIEGTGGHGAGLTRHLLESLESPELVVGARCRVGPSEAVRATPRREVGSPGCNPSRTGGDGATGWEHGWEQGWEHRAAGVNVKPCQCG
jgi:hypothetical protein